MNTMIVEPADSPNPAKARWFQVRHRGRGVGDPLRWMQISALLLLAASLALAFCGCEKKSVVSSSMSPTIKPGEAVTVDYSAYLAGHPRRWDVVVFEPPMFTNQLWAMRVIGLPGETVSVLSNGITINGTHVSVPLSLTNVAYTAAGNSTQPYIVPAQSYYVLGDNASNANDSRYWGAVPGTNIMGRVTGK